jgi:hypothetical protein
MKILIKKKQDEILKRLTANAIMAHMLITDKEAFEKIVDNTVEISCEIGGLNGMMKVQNSVFNYLDNRGEHHE